QRRSRSKPKSRGILLGPRISAYLDLVLHWSRILTRFSSHHHPNSTHDARGLGMSCDYPRRICGSMRRMVAANESAVVPDVAGLIGLGEDTNSNLNFPASPETSTRCAESVRTGSATSWTLTRSSDVVSGFEPRVASANATATLTLPGNFSMASIGLPV